MLEELLQRLGLRDLRMSDCMTPDPHCLRPNDHVFTAKKVMANDAVRHIPVVEGRKLVGIVSERDLYLFERVYQNRKLDRDVQLKELCLFEPYAIDEEKTLLEVLPVMREHKYGCVLVTKEGALTGIFTLIDACTLLEKLMHSYQL